MKWNRKKGLTLAAFLMAFSLAAGIPSEAAENYRIGIGKDQTVTADQTVLLDITVAAPGGTFNTADLTFSYEKDYLTFDQKASTGLDDYTVQEENGKLRLLKYGEKQQDGKVFQLAFHTEKAGTTKVTIDSAQMDVESQAITRACTGSRERSGTGYPDHRGKSKAGKETPSFLPVKTEETATSGIKYSCSGSVYTSESAVCQDGDQGPMLWIVLAAVAMIGCIWVLTRKRRRHE